MQVFTKETGWVSVIKDCKDMLCFLVAVTGYTFYFVRYQDVIRVDETEDFENV